MPTPEEVSVDILTAQLDEQAKEDTTQSLMAEALRQRVGQAQQKLVEKVMGRTAAPQYPPEVVAIANALTAQPRLIAPVDSFLKKLVAAVNDAVSKALAEAMPTESLTPKES